MPQFFDLASETTGNSPTISAFVEDVKKFLQTINSESIQEQLFPLKIIFIVIAIFFFVIFIVLLFKTSWIDWKFLHYLKNFLFPKLLVKRKLLLQWKKLKEGLAKDSEAQWKLSTIEASAILDEVLQGIGYVGSLEDKVNQLNRDDILNLEEIRKAVRVCQDIIRDPDYSLKQETAQFVVEQFEAGLKNLNVL